jgi:hypothetical protein
VLLASRLTHEEGTRNVHLQTGSHLLVPFLVRWRAYPTVNKQGNPRVARQIEAACRTALAKGEVGIKPKRQIPSLEAFVPHVMEEIRKKCAEHPRTAEFYEDAFNRALRFQPLAKAHLQHIDSELPFRFTSRELNEVAPGEPSETRTWGLC